MLAENEKVKRPLLHYYENKLTCIYNPYFISELLQLSNHRQDKESRMTLTLCGWLNYCLIF